MEEMKKSWQERLAEQEAANKVSHVSIKPSLGWVGVFDKSVVKQHTLSNLDAG